MKFKASTITAIFFALFFPFCLPSSIQAQQENDDPNWRERRMEKIQKEIDKLREQHEENKRFLEKMRSEMEEYQRRFLNGPRPNTNSRFLDIYDYGPIPKKHGLILSGHLNMSNLKSS